MHNLRITSSTLSYLTTSNDFDRYARTFYFESCDNHNSDTSISNEFKNTYDFQICNCDYDIMSYTYTSILSCNITNNGCGPNSYGVTGRICGNTFYYVYDSFNAALETIWVDEVTRRLSYNSFCIRL